MTTRRRAPDRKGMKKMSAPRAESASSELSLVRAVQTIGQHILTLVAEAGRRAADRGRFAALPRRYLDDVGMTPGDFAAALDTMQPRDATVAFAHSV
jgi:hypothetical protein